MTEGFIGYLILPTIVLVFIGLLYLIEAGYDRVMGIER